MKRWTVTDRQGREIYLTQERWEHIISKHSELSGRLEDVLTTIRLGRRKSSKRNPQTFLYSRRNESLPEPYDTILVFVAFRYTYLPGSNQQVANNFVTTAWGDVATA
jgi:hypothetical protein